VFIFRNCHQKHQSNKENTELINSLSDTLTTWKNSDSLFHAKIRVIETENTKLFLELELKERELTALQNTVRQYKDRLKEQGSVTLLKTETIFDTVYISQIDYSSNSWCDTIINKWIDFSYCKEDSITKLNLNITNEYEIIIGKEKKQAYAEVINKNPYTATSSMRTYQVKLPKEKRFGVGASIGVALTHDLKFRAYLGLGINYNIIKF
jgi:hypothetical protein